MNDTIVIGSGPRLTRFIDEYTKFYLEEGMSLEHITEAVHVVAAIRGVASLYTLFRRITPLKACSCKRN